jgi:hypothetical protein
MTRLRRDQRKFAFVSEPANPAADAGPRCSLCGGDTVIRAGNYGPPKAICTKCEIGHDLPSKGRKRRGGKRD